MNLDQMNIQVRERSLPEIFDLAVLLSRRHLRAFLVLLCTLGAALTFVEGLLLYQLSGDHLVGNIYLFLLIASAGIPFMAAPVTIFLGRAMFQERTSLGEACRAALRDTGSILLMAFLRFCSALILIGFFFYPPQLPEVAHLERPGSMGRSLSRAWRLGRYYYGENIALLFLLIGFYLWMLFSGQIGLFNVGSTLHWGFEPYTANRLFEDPNYWLFMLLLKAFIIFATVVRFCSYLDLRTKREGWEVELQLRRAGQKFEEEMV